MLEKIGLPAKPSLRGSNWVVDASHCQGCSSQFTFINRKHHCRRCGGIFCNSCTQSRMVLRGQGDSPVRICEPCKKLEEAARFEMRNRHKSRAAKGSSKLASKPEDELLEEILGVVQREATSSKLASDCDTVKTTGSSSCSTVEVASAHDAREVNRVQSDDERDNLHNETASAIPEELRSKASNEKKKYKVLKGEGKSEEALRAFKRGKELERQAEALEKMSLRRNRKKDSRSVRDAIEENGSIHRISHKEGKQNDDFTAELKALGWSDMDSRDDEKRQPSMSLEGELASLLAQNTKKSSSHVTDKSQVVALKKNALMFKREGKLAEAKEELKRAKILEKQLEEQELLAEADDSDDELSAIIRDMGDDREDSMLPLYEHSKALDLDDPLGASDLIGVDGNFEVTEDDMEDPEIAAALTSLGWTEDPDHAGKALHCSAVNKDTVMGEILSLKKEALNQKRAGNTSKAVEQLKKAKLLERSLENIDSPNEHSSLQHSDAIQNNISPQSDDKLVEPLKVGDGYAGAGKDLDVKHANKSRLMIQKELLSVKRKALAFRRDGRYEEAEEELRKAKTLEHQLEQTEKASNVKLKQENPKNEGDDLRHGIPSMSEDSEVPGVDVTDEDLNDPTYLSVLRNLGWKEDGTGTPSISVPQPKERDSAKSSEASLSPAHSKISAKTRTRSKAEIQRELLGLKRKALALRRQSHTDEAEEVLEAAKSLEAELAEMEAPKKLVESSSTNKKDVECREEASQVEGDHVDVSEKDMSDPVLLSVLKDIGWKDEAAEDMAVTKIPSKDLNFSPSDIVGESFNQPSFNHLVAAPKSKREIQKELLGLKRKALALRRNGQTEEADDMLKQATPLEGQMAELEVQKVEPSLHVPKEDRSGSHGGFTEVEKHRNTSMESVATSVDESGPGIESLSGSVKMQAENDLDMLIGKAPPSTEGNKLLSEKEGCSGEMGLLAGVKRVESTSSACPSGNSTNTMDLLAGSDGPSSQADKSEAKERTDSDSSSLAGKTHKGITKESSEVTQSGQKFHGHEGDINQAYVHQKSQDSLKEEVLTRKRNAVALKREGRTAEALEELRQAKLLERTLTSDAASPPEASAIDGQVNVLKDKTSVSPPKPLAGRERFKLQQESLAHKRQALKLRKEGRAQEAEAEFELAKALEAQLEESTSSGPSGYGAIVEDLLDPQLLSALKSIGLDDASLSSHSPEKPEPVKASSVKVDNANAERIQLEEQIKAEKMKAVNFKRSGKQKDALDALRRAKLYEKKLNSMVSS